MPMENKLYLDWLGKVLGQTTEEIRHAVQLSIKDGDLKERAETSLKKLYEYFKYRLAANHKLIKQAEMLYAEEDYGFFAGLGIEAEVKKSKKNKKLWQFVAWLDLAYGRLIAENEKWEKKSLRQLIKEKIDCGATNKYILILDGLIAQLEMVQVMVKEENDKGYDENADA